jgi:hypothetical protein
MDQKSDLSADYHFLLVDKTDYFYPMAVLLDGIGHT